MGVGICRLWPRIVSEAGTALALEPAFCGALTNNSGDQRTPKIMCEQTAVPSSSDICIHELSKEGTLDRWTGQHTVLVGTAGGVVEARTIKRLPPGERWTGSSLDEAQGSDKTPNALEDDGAESGSGRLCCQHMRQFLYRRWCPNFGRCDERRSAELTLSSLVTQTIALDAPNARAGRQQVVDHSEQCRSRMETILATTTEGRGRLERGRDRFAQAAKEADVEEPQRKRHCPEGEGWEPLAPSRSNNQKEAAVAAVRRYHLRHLIHHHLQNEFGTRDRND